MDDTLFLDLPNLWWSNSQTLTVEGGKVIFFFFFFSFCCRLGRCLWLLFCSVLGARRGKIHMVGGLLVVWMPLLIFFGFLFLFLKKICIFFSDTFPLAIPMEGHLTTTPPNHSDFSSARVLVCCSIF